MQKQAQCSLIIRKNLHEFYQHNFTGTEIFW